jgi:hypothetical protein
MGATWGWALALAAVVLGWMQWGWQGVVAAVTFVVFWLLLQFSRALKVMRQASGAPVGRVASAVMVHARLRTGMRLLDILPVTRSLGEAASPAADAGGGFARARGLRLARRVRRARARGALGRARRALGARASQEDPAQGHDGDPQDSPPHSRAAEPAGHARINYAPCARAARLPGGRVPGPLPRSEEPAMSMSDRDGKIWMDGQLVEWRDAKIHVLTHTLHYGCGAFEGVRAYNTASGTAIFRLREHTERLFNSAKILRMKIPFTLEAGDGGAARPWCARTSSKAATCAR